MPFKAPELDRGDGACIHLTDDNQCSIYDDRPDFCRLDPNRPETEQTALCKLQDKNWEKYLQGLTENAGCGILPEIEIDEG